ncbi:MAG: hypothetical protein AB8B81_05615 [Halioglobus sp.]
MSPAPRNFEFTTTHIFLAIFLTWIALHLLLSVIEVVHRPVYPWDAWLAWMYRAKAWFYSNNVHELASPSDWLDGSATSAYTIEAHNYPTFASITPYWSALSLGTWSETLVNTPVIVCGIALGLGLYGQCREAGMGILLSTGAVYLLLSIPLLNTHLSLAGYADIWMAGFTGLGFVALIRGLASHDRYQKLLGFGLVALGMTVKNEGVVWFYAAIVTFIFSSISIRFSFAVLGSATLVALTAWATGYHSVALPIVGIIGVVDGRIHIPFLGSHLLQVWDVSSAYLISFFARGSWNLLWPLLLCATTSLLFISCRAQARTHKLVLPVGSELPNNDSKALVKPLLTFFVVFMASQFFIFGLTEQGRWAEYFTAINRLPLHFAPALVFCIVIFVHIMNTGNPRQKLASKRDEIGVSTLPKSIFAVVCGGVITIIGLLTYMAIALPSGSGEQREFSARDFEIVVGAGILQDKKGIINRFENNIAIVSSGPISLDSTKLQIIEFHIAGENNKNATFFWRNRENARELHSRKASGKGDQVINLSDAPEWEGIVSEIGLLFYDDSGKTAEFHSITVSPQDWTSKLATLWQDWAQFQLWSQKSVNWIPDGATNPLISLQLFITLSLITTILCIAFTYRGLRGAWVALSFCSISAWMVADLRWTANSIFQAYHTVKYYRQNTEPKHLDNGGDLEVARLVAQVKQALAGVDAKLLITATNQQMRFHTLRAKYHLLPIPSITHPGKPEMDPTYLLLLKQRYFEPGASPPSAQQRGDTIGKRVSRTLKILLDMPEGTLYQLKGSSNSRGAKSTDASVDSSASPGKITP